MHLTAARWHDGRAAAGEAERSADGAENRRRGAAAMPTRTVGTMMGLLRILLLMIGVCCVGATTWLGCRDYRRARRWRATEGTVIRLAEVAYDEGSTFFPVVEFRDDRGSVVAFQSTTGSYPPQYGVGATVRVCYPPQDPKAAQIIGERRWAVVLLGAMGIISLAVGMLVARP